MQFNIAVCIKELQDEDRKARYKALQASYKGGPCIGLQLDMWTDTNTHVSYAGLNGVTVREPTATEFAAASTGKRPLQLVAQSEVISFDVFPSTSHTGAAIRDWLTNVCEAEDISFNSISGVAPDGAADGQCGLKLMPELREKVDTCDLHRLQRAVLFSIGVAGAVSQNPEAKDHLRGHGRIAQANNQIRAVSYGIREKQENARVPPANVLSTVDTMPTRWGNQYRQVERNNTLRPVLEPTISEWKRENRSKKEAIVETDSSDSGSKLGNAVAAAAIGFTRPACRVMLVPLA